MVRQFALIFQLRKDGFRWIDAWRFARAFNGSSGIMVRGRRHPRANEW